MMRKRGVMGVVLAGAVAMGSLGGCEDLPGDRGTQGAVIGGVAGGATGAAVGGEDNRLLGALIGAAAGAGGGYLIGAEIDKTEGTEEDQREAQQAVEEAQADPATPADVQEADTADLNEDGFVTMDEVIAMADADLGEEEILRRMEATDQIFELTPEQEEDLVNAGVSRRVVREMQTLNQEARERVLRDRDDVISRDRDDVDRTRGAPPSRR